MRLLKNFIFDKTNLIIAYFETIFLQIFVLRIFLSGNLYNSSCQLLWGINIIWVLVILLKDISKNNISIKDKKTFLLTLYFIIALISWLFYRKKYNLYSIYDLIKLYEFCFIFYLIPFEVKSREKLHKMLEIISYSFCTYVFVFLSISLILYILEIDQVTLPNGISQSLYGLDNALAHKPRFFGIWNWATDSSFHSYIAICLHLYLMDRNKNKLVNWFCIFLCLIMIYLSDTRTSFIILAIIIMCFLSFKIQNKVSKKNSIIIDFCLILIACMGLIFIKSKTNPELISSLLINPIETFNKLSSGRMTSAKGIIKNLKNSPLFGDGYANNTYMSTYYSGINYPHNLFFSLLLYTGILGFAVFTIFLILNGLTIIKNSEYIKANNFKWIAVLSICIFVQSMFSPAILGTATSNVESLFFFLCLGISANKCKN